MKCVKETGGCMEEGRKPIGRFMKEDENKKWMYRERNQKIIV